MEAIAMQSEHRDDIQNSPLAWILFVCGFALCVCTILYVFESQGEVLAISNIASDQCYNTAPMPSDFSQYAQK
jgi:hypothetical protein